MLLLRHGRTAANAGGRIQGQLDVPLDDLGRRQAAALADVFAADPPSVVASSDLARARETAEVLAGGRPVRLDLRLRELDLGTWQGLTTEEARLAHPEEHAAWRAGQDLARGGGETYADGGRRAAECVRELLVEVPPGGMLVAVTHGGTARGAAGVMLGLDPSSWWLLAPLGNTCWSTLVEGDRGWRLERHGVGPGPLLGPPTGAHDLGALPGDRALPVR